MECEAWERGGTWMVGVRGVSDGWDLWYMELFLVGVLGAKMRTNWIVLRCL
jgi:hypothetical protein